MARTAEGDTLSRFLADLRNRHQDVRAKAAKNLRTYVEGEARDMSSEQFTKYMNDLNKRIFDLVNSTDAHEKMGGIMVIDELLDVPYEENETKIIRFANYLRMIFTAEPSDLRLLRKASRALGHLVRAGGTLATDIVEFDMKRALEWLQGDRSEQRRYAAVLVLKELAENLPTLFNVHVAIFLDNIWQTLRDPKVIIREAAVEALHHCLLLIAKRVTKLRSTRYGKIFTEVQMSFKSKNADSIHGALLTIGELLTTTGDFMLSRFKEVCDTVMEYKDHKDPLVRETVIALLPKLASFEPEAFVRSYLQTSLQYIIATLKKKDVEGNSRSIAFTALGEMALAVKDNMASQLDVIVPLVKEGLVTPPPKPTPTDKSSSSSKSFASNKALTCVSMLAKAVGPKLIPHMKDLVDQMFSAGLSPTLVDALTDLSIHIPILLSSIQERLLTSIGIILDGGAGGKQIVRDTKRSSSLMTSLYSRATHTRSASTSPNESKYGPDPAVTELLQLALATLAKFDFSAHNLLPFVRDVVMSYLDHDQPLIRQQAAITCSALILPLKRKLKEKKPVEKGHNHHSAAADSKERKEKEWAAREKEWKELKEREARGEIKIGGDDDEPLVDVDEDADLLLMKRASVAAICEILERLLTVGIADSDPLIRRTVLEALDSRFDHFLAQAENLHFLFVALNDEVFAIREAAISVIGRLAVRNPAYVMPPLRKTLIQLLTELQYSGDGSKREESAKLLGHLIAHSRRLMKPYVAPILRVLVPKLRGDPNVATAALATLGRLSTIGGEDMTEHLDQLMPIIIGTLQDKSSMVKREVALRTLGELVESTGYVIEPYLRYCDLLPTILNILKSGQLPVVRREVVKVLGIIGALDPFKHKMNQLRRRTDRAKGADKDKKTDGKTESKTGAPGSPKKAPGATGAAAGAAPADGKEGGALEAGAAAGADSHPGLTHFSDDYFPTVAINALMRILKDSSLTTHHNKVIGAVMFIFRSLGMRCVPFLPQIIPPFLAVMRSSEESVRESLFKELGVLVTIVKSNIRNYLDGIFALIHEYWKDTNLLSEQILVLLEIISLALRDEFKIYLPDLLPQLLTILHSDRTEKRIPTNKVLHALETFGANLDDYLHLIVPAMVKLFEQPDSPLAVRQRAVFTVGALCRQLNMSDYASRILHPLARVIEVHSERLTSPTNTKNVHTLSPLCEEAMSTLCILVCQLGPAYAIFVPMFGKLFQRRQIKHDLYDSLIGKIVAGVQLEMKDLPPPPISTTRTNSLGPMDAKELGLTFEGVPTGPHEKLQVNQLNLKKTWETSARSTRDDWMDWYRIFSIELLKESPSPALRACSTLAQKYHPLARELFNAAFVSCWTELHDMAQDDLVRSLEFAFKAPSIPADLLQTLLNLAEFMEHDSKPLPIDISTLGLLAEKCHAYAKALHYKELEFRLDPSNTIEALISINNQLQQPDAAVGILVYAKHHHSLELRESWYEKLQRWEDALEAYERRQLEAADNVEFTLGRMRCLRALGEWERLATLGSDLWTRSSDSVRRDVAPLAAAAAWNLGQWELMPQYLSAMDEGKSESEFFRALLSVHRRQFPEARKHIDRTRVLLETELTALVGESYNRAYRVMVQVQQMAELEEIIRYKECRDPEQKAMIRKMWTARLKGCQRDVDVWQQILAVRSIVVSPKEDIPTWLNFSSLCRKSGRYAMSLKVLTSLFTFDPHKVMPSATSSPTLTLPSSPMTPAPRGLSIAVSSPTPVRKPSLTSSSPGGLVITSPGKVVTAVAGIAKPPPIPPYHSSNAPATLSSGPMSPSHAHSMSIHKGRNNYYYGYTTDTPLPKQYPQVSFAYAKHLWAAGFHDEAFKKMGVLVQQLEEKTRAFEASTPKPSTFAAPPSSTSGFTSASSLSILNLSSPATPSTPVTTSWTNGGAATTELDAAEILNLKARCYLRLGDWQLSMHDKLDNDLIPQVLNNFHRATLCDSKSYKVWHGFAVMNFRIVSHYSSLKQAAIARQPAAERKDSKRPDLRIASSRPSLSGTPSSLTSASATAIEIAELQRKIDAHVVPGINGFFRSIALAGDQSLQDILRLLTLWFSHGSHPEAETALRRGFNTISIDTWLAVIPQIIARIHTSHLPMIDELLQKIGRAHPQALVYSLTVACKSASVPRRIAATNILNKLREHSPVLVEQSAMVSHELIRVAILWHEMWHEALEEASRLWFGQHNVDAMFQTLAPLHEMMAEGPQTLREVSFMQNYGRDLQEAYEWCQKYKRYNKESDLNQAWDLYCSVFRLVNKQLTGVTDLELQYVSPKLLAARDLELAVPGTYLRDDSRGAVDSSQIIHIGSFVPSLRVIESKQRPRKLQIRGGDGQDYGFLLKGHEDLRQDKRVMQLFGLVNTLLANDNDTAKKDLKIRAYSVIPLAPNSGLIQWMQNTDTLHALIKDYRDARRVLLNIEHRLMLQMAPDYLSLTQMQKVEVFEFALTRTTGQDLYKVLWLKSHNSEVWLDRRTNYTRSLAVMSMVGYILGLGDRHPCNLMLDRYTGKIVHIDFGDCFEVAMHREKFPEKIPFRLTRMLINAMEVSGIEGNFRSTCESVIRVLRANKESVMAVLEAFVYDPLINWRLLQTKKDTIRGEPEEDGPLLTSRKPGHGAAGNGGVDDGMTPSRGMARPVAVDANGAAVSESEGSDGEDSEVLNAKAVSVVTRVESKLTGKDFGDYVLDVPAQVENLIRQATSHINLCQCYIGWCPFW